MQRDASHHRNDEGNDECRSRAVHGGDAPRRDHASEMVEANNRMTEPGQHALAESRRGPAAHHVMGESGSGAERQSHRNQDHAFEPQIHEHFSLVASLAR